MDLAGITEHLLGAWCWRSSREQNCAPGLGELVSGGRRQTVNKYTSQCRFSDGGSSECSGEK